MVKLSKEEILHVAKLAKLSLKDTEIKKFSPQLSNVISFVSELSEVDTKNIEPTSQTTGLENIKRSDEIIEVSTLTQKKAISGTDEIHNGYFKVKAILEGRTDK